MLNKVFVREFYRMNSGFFLLILTLAFGFMSKVEHLALAQFFVSSPALLLIPIGIWVVYTGQIVGFNSSQLMADEMRFAFNVQFLPFYQQFALLTLVTMLQLLPVLGYGFFLVLVASKIEAFQSVVIIPVSIVVIWSACSLLMVRKMRNPSNDQRLSFARRYFDTHYVRNIIQFYTEGLLRTDPVMIGGTKLLTTSLTFGVCVLYRYDDFDGRLLAMAITFCGVANALVIFRLVAFEHTHIAWMKNMPIPFWKRFTRLLVVVCMLVLPEAVVLLRIYPVHIDKASSLFDMLYLISLGAFFLGYFHLRSAPLEDYTRKVFWIFITLIILILFKVPLSIFITLNFLIGYLLFRRGYYSREISE